MSPAPSVRAYPFRTDHRLDLDPEFEPLWNSEALERVRLPYGGDAWLAVRYPHVRQVLTGKEFSRREANDVHAPRLSSEVLPASSLMALDGEDHLRIRMALAASMSAEAILQLEGSVRADAERLVEQMLTGGPQCDIVAGLAEKLPVLAVCAVLQVDATAVMGFRDFAVTLRERDRDPRERDAARFAFEQLVVDLIQVQRESGTGPLKDWTTTSHRGDPLTITEAVDAVIALVVGGVGSPSTFLGSGLLAVLRQPEILDLIRRDAGVVPEVVEELLRLVPIGVGGGFVRVATSDVTVGDTLVRAGEAVLPAMIAANRDPAFFTDADRIVIGRPVRRHLGMGLGAHHCVGSQLARLEMRAALELVAKRMPGLRLACSEEDLVWRKGLVVRELDSLPVRWSS